MLGLLNEIVVLFSYAVWCFLCSVLGLLLHLVYVDMMHFYWQDVFISQDVFYSQVVFVGDTEITMSAKSFDDLKEKANTAL